MVAPCILLERLHTEPAAGRAMPGLIDHVAELNRATIINALLRAFSGHAAHLGQVSRVVFRRSLPAPIPE